MNWKNPQGETKKAKAHRPFLVSGACEDCRQVHPVEVECAEATLPCHKCNAPLRHGERWTSVNFPEISCAPCFFLHRNL